MSRTFLALGLLVLCATANAAATLRAAEATYAVSRDGKVIGSATYALRANADGTWTLHSQTRGTNGMAKLLGLDVREESVFALRDGQLQGVSYSYTQDAAIKHKHRNIDFDANAQTIHVRDNGKDFHYAMQAGAIDRSAVAIALGLALADGATSTTLPVAVKDRIEMQQFTARAAAPLDLAKGRVDAIEIDRSDAPGKVKSWYATGGLLPVRVEQAQHDGATLVMEATQDAAHR